MRRSRHKLHYFSVICEYNEADDPMNKGCFWRSLCKVSAKLNWISYNRMFFPRSPLIDGATRMRTTRWRVRVFIECVCDILRQANAFKHCSRMITYVLYNIYKTTDARLIIFPIGIAVGNDGLFTFHISSHLRAYIDAFYVQTTFPSCLDRV